MCKGKCKVTPNHQVPSIGETAFITLTNADTEVVDTEPLQRLTRPARLKAVEAISGKATKKQKPSSAVEARKTRAHNEDEPKAPDGARELPVAMTTCGAMKSTYADVANVTSEYSSVVIHKSDEGIDNGIERFTAWTQPRRFRRSVIRATGEADTELLTIEPAKYVHVWNFHPDVMKRSQYILKRNNQTQILQSKNQTLPTKTTTVL
ncbi:unnamed protein product [Arctia plantaginis]|uniref:Uncharacterized protein n=1 Tax=Arctia plantaginis TaxID=874455 RepID=A0A8S1AW80_ARCPL|nr:unnamed protein product [Arctia plantaginis]